MMLETVTAQLRQKPLLWLLMLIPASFLAMGFLCCGGCIFIAAFDSAVDPADFKDHPERFKGKTVTLNMFYQSEHPIREWRELKMSRGAKTYDIYLYRASEHLMVRVDVPASLKVPALENNESVDVTFRCTKGSPLEGNIAVRITRHDY
jgi:hypothetical protein